MRSGRERGVPGDDLGQWRDVVVEGEAVEEVVPETDAEFLAGFLEAGEGVTGTRLDVSCCYRSPLDDPALFHGQRIYLTENRESRPTTPALHRVIEELLYKGRLDMRISRFSG